LQDEGKNSVNVREKENMSEHTGGGKIGKISSSWPFGKLTIRDDGITVSIGIQKVRLRRENIKSILFKKGLINSKFAFVHDDNTIKPNVEYWTFSPAAAADDLKAQGYVVTESK
jgi:hypothetical protein